VKWLNGKHMAGTSLAEEWFAPRPHPESGALPMNTYTRNQLRADASHLCPGNLLSIRAFVDASANFS